MGHDKLFQKRKATLSRKMDIRKPRTILIVCEGEKTEPNYFRCFPHKPLVCDNINVKGTGYNTVSLVKETIRLKKEARENKEEYIEVWCVFDKDSFSQKDFMEAIRLAKENDIKCAYSIEAFELWYLLHFNYYDAALCRTQYKDKISKEIGKTYTKNSKEMYKLLEKKQTFAIKNARKLYEQKKSLPYASQNPVTTVFKLVEKLRGD